MARPSASGPLRFLPMIISVAALIYVLLANAFDFAALADHPDIGKAFRDGVSDDAPVVAGYILLGDLLRTAGPLRAMGDETARAAAAPLRERIVAYPPSAVPVFFGDVLSPEQSRMRWQHRLAPWLVGLALFAWWRRPKSVHLIRQTRQRA